MNFLTSTSNQKGLPRYFSQAFGVIKKIKNGRLDVKLEDGRIFRAEGKSEGPHAEFTVHNDDLFARLVREGDLGFSDAYLDGWWTTPDLQAFMDLMHLDNDDVYSGFPGMGLVRLYERVRFWLRSNSRKQAKKNISYHYDLGNKFYSLWLDKSMTYSSALFKKDSETLEKAQENKYESIIDQLGVKPGDHILEIGCGWGGFCEYAATKRGIKVTGLTISQEQYDYAIKRMADGGLSDKVEIKLQDYRDETGVYDGIASIEMFEAVGEKYWPIYFSTVRDRLKPGCNATLQIITLADNRWEAYRKGVDFIQKYIFPGGMLPCPSVLKEQVHRAGLQVKGSIEFGQSYSATLRRWHAEFNKQWDNIVGLGFDKRFKNMWDFYLTSCAGTFMQGYCDVTQITINKPK
jgi:cyclopropane-fatty-acyl-phospholipid synthase